MLALYMSPGSSSMATHIMLHEIGVDFESRWISFAKRYPAAGLFPVGDLDTEAQIISWMSFIASTVHPARRIGVERWKEVFEIAEKRLARKDWAVGRYSIADIHLFRLFWRFFTTLHPAADAYPGLFGHYERMMARPAVKKTIEIEAAVGYQLPQ